VIVDQEAKARSATIERGKNDADKPIEDYYTFKTSWAYATKHVAIPVGAERAEDTVTAADTGKPLMMILQDQERWHDHPDEISDYRQHSNDAESMRFSSR